MATTVAAKTDEDASQFLIKKLPFSPHACCVTGNSAGSVLLFHLYNLTAYLLWVTFAVEKNAYFCQILHRNGYW
jgi:hypothetical protein